MLYGVAVVLGIHALAHAIGAFQRGSPLAAFVAAVDLGGAVICAVTA